MFFLRGPVTLDFFKTTQRDSFKNTKTTFKILSKEVQNYNLIIWKKTS